MEDEKSPMKRVFSQALWGMRANFAFRALQKRSGSCLATWLPNNPHPISKENYLAFTLKQQLGIAYESLGRSTAFKAVAPLQRRSLEFLSAKKERNETFGVPSEWQIHIVDIPAFPPYLVM